MSDRVTIEVDKHTADVLHSRAAELGVSVSELVTELAATDTEPAVADAEQIAELDRRWQAIEGGRPTVPHDRVARWLRTWGTRRFRPWQAP
jgi:predicted transcriptional regulator